MGNSWTNLSCILNVTNFSSVGLLSCIFSHKDNIGSGRGYGGVTVSNSFLMIKLLPKISFMYNGNKFNFFVFLSLK